MSFAASTALLGISSLNYPGGEALRILHTGMEHPQRPHFDVYFDNLACQTGVTRFLENHQGAQTILDDLEAQVTTEKRTWAYDKTENPISLGDPMFWAKFDYVLVESPEIVIGKWAARHVVYGFGGVKVLKPGEDSSSHAEPLHEGDNKVVMGQDWTNSIANLWHRLEVLTRDRVLRGYWVKLRMEPKIWILQTQMK